MAKHHTRGSEWLVIKRCLVILQRLMTSPATGAEIIQAVEAELGSEAYSSNADARRKAFENDRQNLRYRLQVNFSYDATTGVYILDDPGPFGYLVFTPRALSALHLLLETFTGQVGEMADIQPLIEELIQRLAPDLRRKLEQGSQPLDVDVFQDVDPVAINRKVWETVKHAVDTHRKLTFNYISPSHADQKPRYHEVAPYQVRFKRGHWYLYAYSLKWLNPDGKQNWTKQHLNFRLQYISDDDTLQIHPQVVSQIPRTPPRYLVHYRLAPPVGRGNISQHFENMQVLSLGEGWVEVRAETDDVWEAARTLLGYGENCIVQGGEELLAKMRKHVEGLARSYGYGGEG